MTNMFLMSGQKRSLFQKMWAGFMSFVLAVVWGGSSAVFALVAVPTVAHAVVVPQTLFTNGFESGNFSAWTSVDSPKWSISNTQHTGAKSGKVTGDTGNNPDVLKKLLSTAQYENITLSYWYKADDLESRVLVPGHWEGQHHHRHWVSDAWTGNNDTVKLEYTLNGSAWVTLDTIDNNHDDDNWHKRMPVLPSGAANNVNFGIRFVASLDDSDDEVRIDDVLVEGVRLSQPEDNTEACSDSLDNDNDGLVDSADPSCLGMFTFTKNVVGSDKPASDFTVKLCPRVGPPMLETLNAVLGVKVANATEVDPCITLTSGQAVTVPPGWYQVVETPTPNFIAQFTDGQCNFDGYVHVGINDTDTCTLTNTYIAPPQCSDGVDNDEDDKIDYPSDLGCTSADDNTENSVPPPQACSEQVSSMTVVSDLNDRIVENAYANAVATYSAHPEWTASIPGATWIWEAFNVFDPLVDTTKTFTKDFVLNGFPTSASLKVAADNSYRYWLNGNLVCEDSSENNFSLSGQDTCSVNLAYLHPGVNTLKMEVKNWELAGGTPESNPAGALYELSVSYDSCPFATISATKIVCEDESMLPNLSGADVIITASTASDFLLEHQSCHLESGWQFQSANQTGADAGDAFLGEAGSPYVTSAPTNAQGLTTWTVPLTGVTELHVREVLKDGYIPFTFNSGNSDVSAEMWCAEDVLHYDNFDFIRNPVSGTTYHCVAMNVPKDTEEPVDQCLNQDGFQEVVPEGYYRNEGNCYPNQEPVDLCVNLEGTQTTVPEGYAAEGNQCNLIPVRTGGGGGGSQPPACADGSDNDNDGKADFPNDPGCSDSLDNDETGVPVPAAVPTTGGDTSGEVLGAATAEPALPPQCSEYLTEYIKFGKKNNPEEVKKLQTFLNEVMGSNLPVTGYYGSLTRTTVKNFQKKYNSDILLPWVNAGWKGKDLEDGTGYVYKTTKRWVNLMKCQTLVIPLPDLKAS